MALAKVRNFNCSHSIPCIINGKKGYFNTEFNTIYNVAQPENIQDNEYNLLVEIRHNEWILCNSIDFDFF